MSYTNCWSEKAHLRIIFFFLIWTPSKVVFVPGKYDSICVGPWIQNFFYSKLVTLDMKQAESQEEANYRALSWHVVTKHRVNFTGHWYILYMTTQSFLESLFSISKMPTIKSRLYDEVMKAAEQLTWSLILFWWHHPAYTYLEAQKKSVNTWILLTL